MRRRLAQLAPPPLKQPDSIAKILNIPKIPSDISYGKSIALGGDSIIVGFRRQSPRMVGVCKITHFSFTDAIKRIENYLDILRVIRSLPKIGGILPPTAIYYDDENSVSGKKISGTIPSRQEQFGAQQKEFLVELYDMCGPYEIPRNKSKFIKDIVHLIETFLMLHSHCIAHMDFKIENLMILRPSSKLDLNLARLEANVPVIIDFAEARFCDKRSAKLPVATTRGLIVRDPYVQSLKVQEFSRGPTLSRLPVPVFLSRLEQEPSMYPLLDQLMFGIFLKNSAQACEFREMEAIGKRLIFSAFESINERHHMYAIKKSEFHVPLNFLTALAEIQTLQHKLSSIHTS